MSPFRFQHFQLPISNSLWPRLSFQPPATMTTQEGFIVALHLQSDNSANTAILKFDKRPDSATSELCFLRKGESGTPQRIDLSRCCIWDSIHFFGLPDKNYLIELQYFRNNLKVIVGKITRLCAVQFIVIKKLFDKFETKECEVDFSGSR